jgi:hypothetical protein
MMKLLLLFAVWSLAVVPQLCAKENEDAAIVSAAETYLRTNATVTTNVKFIVEQVEGDVVRVRINPQDKPARDTAWIFMKKKDGKWAGITFGTGFSPEEYERLGIPKSLRIP